MSKKFLLAEKFVFDRVPPEGLLFAKFLRWKFLFVKISIRWILFHLWNSSKFSSQKLVFDKFLWSFKNHFCSEKSSHFHCTLFEIGTIDRKNESESELIVRSNSTWNNIWSTRLIDFLRLVTHIRLTRITKTLEHRARFKLSSASLKQHLGEDLKKVQASGWH